MEEELRLGPNRLAMLTELETETQSQRLFTQAQLWKHGRKYCCPGEFTLSGTTASYLTGLVSVYRFISELSKLSSRKSFIVAAAWLNKFHCARKKTYTYTHKTHKNKATLRSVEEEISCRKPGNKSVIQTGITNSVWEAKETDDGGSQGMRKEGDDLDPS